MTACDWHHPGADPYTGTKAAAIAHYTQIPAATRAKLGARMEANQFDQVVVITRDAIGNGAFEPAITQMHFGAGRVCDTVDRSGWFVTEQQPALVYCEDGHCLIEPVICHNVSYVRRAVPREPAAAAPLTFDAPAAGAEPGPTAISADSFESALLDEPPAAGPAGYPVFGTPAFFPTLPGVVTPFIPAGPIAPIPEPSTWALMALGVAAITLKRSDMSITRLVAGAARRRPLLVAAVLAAFLSLAACGGGGDEDTKPTPAVDCGRKCSL